VKSFQFRVTCWIALALFGLMFVSLVVFNIYAIHEVLHQSRKGMKTLSRVVLSEIETKQAAGETISPESFRGIDQSLATLAPNSPIAYAVFTTAGELVHRTARFEGLADRSLLEGESEDLVVQRIASTGGVGELLSEWHVLLRNQAHGYTVLVSDLEDYESVERFLSGFAIIVLLAALLSVPCGYLLSRRILVPLAAVETTIREVRQGNLEARVPVPKTKDEIAELARALNHTFADLDALLDGMRRFCADAAHELKTPLTALRGNLEVCLAKERNEAEYQAVLAESVTEIASLSAMVHDLLLLSISGDRRRTASHHELAPGPLFREVAGQLSMLAEEKQVQFEQQIDDDLVISGDEALLPRICGNLLDNAIRFAPAGSRVAVRWQEENGEAVLTVADHGPGVAPEDQERIFERFYQVAESRSRGTGLGLAIVKWIAELHDGRVTIESTPGEGATFRVHLPVRAEQP
jgi:heavy metal sensor kinase